MSQLSMRSNHPAERNPAIESLASAGAEGNVARPSRNRPRAVGLCLFLLVVAVALLGGSGSAVADNYGTGAWDDPPELACHRGSTLHRGQKRIDQGRYHDAIYVFSCVIQRDPLSVQAYRGRAEAKLMLRHFADAFSDYALVTANVLPVHPDGHETILDGYERRLLRDPTDVAALTGESFARWTFYDFEPAITLLDQLLVIDPNDVFANLFRGSSRLFLGVDVAGGIADMDNAIDLAPWNRGVRYIVADAYTYAYPDLERAFDEATLALQWGLDTPRVHAILVNCYLSGGDLANAAYHLQRHFQLVTTQIVPATAPLNPTNSVTIDLAPGKTFEFPVPVTAGGTISIRTDSPSFEIYDSITVLLAPDGTPVAGNDDFNAYLAGFDWVAPETGTYKLRVTSFEGVSTGHLVVTRN